MNTFEPRRTFRRALMPAACAALLSGCAPFDPYPSQSSTTPVIEAPVALFDRLDINRDGFLSRAEVEALGISTQPAASVESATAAFHRLDTNGDGFLSRAEAQVTLGAIPGASFDVADTDRNGFLSLTEAMPHLRWLESRSTPAYRSFDGYDMNRDGLLSRPEAEPLLRSTQMVDGRYVVVMPAGVPAAPAVSFEGLDANRDGFLSRGEAASIANAGSFDRFDTNRDGFLSRGEADALIRSVGGTTGTYGGTVYGPRY
jgi:Ca2+-binding EF-hand superfamily protein